ncbi:MAG: hypothetical protein ABSB78_12390 [Bacteroidota bacterium]
MKTLTRLVLFSLLLILNNADVFTQTQQPSGRQYRQWAIMNGNQVQTVFGNWGVIGQPQEQGHRGAWKYPNNGYLGDVSPLVGAEVKYDSAYRNGQWIQTPNSVFHEVVTCPVNRPTLLTDTDPRTGKYWTFEPEAGYFNPQKNKIAMSDDKTTWPTTWPDKLQDLNDPGWPNSWNGYFGKNRKNADLETYFVMDDNNDERYNNAGNNPLGVAFKPDSTNSSRNGLGLVMSVRAMQWAQFLAKDNIFWLYEITNTGTTNYDRAVFGMLVGTYVGVTSTEDFGEYRDDWSFFDVTENLTYTGDIKGIRGQCMNNPLWQPTPCSGTGLVGYAFLESPGNPYDGIDNDGDADSSLTGMLAPKFTSASFDSTLLIPGMQIILIRDDYSRYVYTIPSTDSVQITTRGLTRWIYPGKTWVSEGNVRSDRSINPNAYDGVDNNYNGLIDENYYLHYRQVKRTKEGIVLFDLLRPVSYINYLTGTGSDSYSMIDERRDDRIDNNRNWNILHDDIGRDGVANTGDFGEGDGLPTSGYDDFGNDTGLPGEPRVDKTDVKESDQIGLTSFFYFTPAGNFKMGDKDTMWVYLAPGFFDVPNVIQNNRPVDGADGDFIYGSGYFPLRAKKTERFSLALVFGGGKRQGYDVDVADLLKNKRTVQKIYDANYQFPQPPDLPTLTAVPSDKRVTLYWDRVAEETIDPLIQTKTFEGYKIYRSTDPTFNDILTITDGSGTAAGYQPLKQYDLKDGITGYFHTSGQLFSDISGFAYYLGSDNGIVHSFVDSSVQNGRTYYYALVAYNHGDEYIEILPAENKINVSISPSGEVSVGQNCAVVVPNAKTLDYLRPIDGVLLDHLSGSGTGDAYFKVDDNTKITGNRYRVEFLDTQVDGIDNNDNGLIDLADSSEWDRRTTSYSVRDLSEQSEEFSFVDTTVVTLRRKNFVPGTITVYDNQGILISDSLYKLNLKTGQIRGKHSGTLPTGQCTIKYQYYPVYQSKYIRGTPFATDSKDADVFDGVELVFNNPWEVEKVDSLTKWTSTKPAYRLDMYLIDLYNGLQEPLVHGFKKPSDYEFIFDSTAFIDTSYADTTLASDPIPTHFRIYNMTEKTFVKFSYTTLNFINRGRLAPKDDIFLYEKNPRGGYSYTWELFFDSNDGKLIPYHKDDTLRIITSKPFEQGDTLTFITTKPKLDNSITQDALSRIRVVPNPYVSASTLESPLPPSVTSGRIRRIDFIHLPAFAKIHIYTSRGDHVISLFHDGNIEDGHVSWNLKTKENLDIAYGIYFYVVESPVGTKTGKIAIIK